ncbi:hepatic lectin-like [Scomber japonicus]|uniref:hepatic lectin-like n=1 Tax=Scomber japonicus TaxID=13676 RepID=UPI0023057460|nr:hepatic lectin-like [Scomber japonicus]
MMSHTEGEALASQQPAVSRGGSKVRLERVALLFLAALLGAAIMVIYRLCVDNTQTRRSFNELKDENEALKKNFTGRSLTLSTKSCPHFSCSSAMLPYFKGDSCLKCDKHWEQHLGKCYYFSTKRSSWEDSRRFCQGRGGDLVKIDSREEQEFLEKKVLDKMRNDEDRFWIGLTDSKEENKWIWVDGSPLNTSLSFWFEGEPDNWKDLGTDPAGEDCVGIGERGGAKDLKSWFDRQCKGDHRSICKKPAQTGRLHVCV